MIPEKRELILKELSEGTGANFAATEVRDGLRHGLRIWFSDLDENHGPVAEIRAFGLKGFRVGLFFGNFSGYVIEQINRAAQEDVQLARALVGSIKNSILVEIPGQGMADWSVRDGTFEMKATVRNQDHLNEDAALIAICREVIVPIMASMAELIGYDIIDEEPALEIPVFEGAILQSVVTRRERNPRNRLLCIRIHGEKCVACGLRPKEKYGKAGSIIEVHHLEPLASLVEPRPYDPRIDLVPLCPGCHRAVHTRRPVPFSLEELEKFMESSSV